MVEILGSSITSNVIAALSFIVCFASLVVTFRTMTSAKKIQEEMERMKINALDRQRFLKYREIAIKSIERQKNLWKRQKSLVKKIVCHCLSW